MPIIPFPHKDKVTVVNMIPNSLSDETHQDSEPNLAVNPENPQQMAATAFTPNPNGGQNSPIYYSNDGGNTWNLLEIISGTPVRDQTLRFALSGGRLYAGVLWGNGNSISQINFDILSTNDFTGNNVMTRLARRTNDDQPFIQASTVPSGPDAGKDRVYVGSNDWAPTFPTATIDQSLDAGANNPTLNTNRLESRTVTRDGFQTRPAVHSDGTVYAIFYAWVNGAATSDVVICRDDNWGSSAKPFQALLDPNDNQPGLRIVTGVDNPGLSINLGQQRIGGDLSVAVDPSNSSIVYVCWGDITNQVYTLHIRKSTDRGATWSNKDLRQIGNATNPALAITEGKRLGFLYQQVTGTSPNQRWQTIVELTTNDFISTTSHVLADTPANTPTSTFDPYIGDYLYMMAVGNSFYGIFSANNTPDTANFPSGITYQRNADWTNHVLKDAKGNTVAVSIDPFFFKIEPVIFKIWKEIKPEIIEKFWIFDKSWILDKFWKLENPEHKLPWEGKISPEGKIFDKLEDGYNWMAHEAEILRLIAKRIDDIEERLAKGKAFITEEERPQPGDIAKKRKSTTDS